MSTQEIIRELTKLNRDELAQVDLKLHELLGASEVVVTSDPSHRGACLTRMSNSISDGKILNSPIDTNITADRLAALYILDSLKGFGPQKFKALWDSGLTASNVLACPERLQIAGKTGEKLKEELGNISAKTQSECASRAERQLEAASKHGAKIISFGTPEYAANLLRSSYPVPILYVRGDLRVLTNRKTVACVGSRKIRPPYAELHRKFSQAASAQGFAVVSGFALGADTVGHKAAFDSRGQTICVMPGGLDRPFPPENRELWNAFLAGDGAVFVSEFPFGTSASSLTLRKRNKMIVALALGVLISQSSKTGGAMNAFRFAIEQKKRLATFQEDGTEETSGNAEVAAETKVPSVVFPAEVPSAERYKEWLRKLSSSI